VVDRPRSEEPIHASNLGLYDDAVIDTRSIRRSWRRYTTSWTWPTMVTAAGLATIIAVSQYTDPDRDDPWYWTVLSLVGILVLIGGGLGLGVWLQERDIRLNPESRQRRVTELSMALESALRTVATIKAEIEEGDQLLAELERRTTTSRALARLDDPQVVAVAEQLRGELRAERRFGLLRDAAFFGLGILVTLLFNIL
jgi:hypothetical protein